MQTLVVIPSLMHKYSFSAPLAWLFSGHLDRVKGVYSVTLNEEIVKQYDRFIVELNWFIELVEFELIVRFIKKHNPKAVILFGGLYSQLKYAEVFANTPVDYFIKGDNELPIRQFLDGVDPRRIPNMVGRDFENEQSYIFQQEEFKDLEFSLDWIPDYARHWEGSAAPDDHLSPNYDELPRYPKYWEKPGEKIAPELRWRVPSRGGRYHLPMLITGRGECQAVHPGCDYCMGAKSQVMRTIYGRPARVMDNDTLVDHLHRLEKKFDKISLFINTPCTYDFRGHRFDLEATIEIDSPNTAQDVARILPAFRKAIVHTAIYQEGLLGKVTRSDIAAYQALEDENHKVYYFAFDEDALASAVPRERRLYAEVIFPAWADWAFYNVRANALKKSREWYFATGQTNLYPLPRQMVMRLTRPVITNLLYALHKLKLVDMKKKLV
ncbi:MAG: hypothetical protein ACOYYS_21890 [Chloroflexota bacterium]